MTDHRSDRARRIEDLVPTDRGTLGGYALTFLRDLEVRGYAEHTVRNLHAHLRVFICWCHERGLETLDEVTPEVLKRYQRQLYHHRTESGRRLSFNTQRQRLSAVKRLYRWLLKERLLDWNPTDTLDLPRTEQRLPRAVLSMREAERVLAQPDLRTPVGVRDRAILETLYSTGIRRQELVDLDLYSVDVASGVLSVRQGKGKKDRMIPIGRRALDWVERYLEEVRPELAPEPDEGALFLTVLRTRFSPERMSLLVRQYVATANLGKIGACHLFRHTMATLMLEGGADIRFIQAMLGHVKIETTQVYTRVAIRKLKEVHELTHPGANPRPKQPGAAAAPEDVAGEGESVGEEEELLSTLAAEAAEDGEGGDDHTAGDVGA